MSVLRHRIRRGAYADSIVLMQLQSALASLPGIEDAGAVMATHANLDLLRASGLLPARHEAGEAELEAGPDDLLIALRAETTDAADGAFEKVDSLLARREASGDSEYRPKSLRGALRLQPAAAWALVSVPGRWAARVAREALEADRNVFLYSDNVSVEDEVALKATAAQRGRLVMGPDCGTAVIAGTGLGFANRVRRGPIGIVAAAGTGLQSVASRVHALGSGISQAIGTGGRDLSAAVGGATALQGLRLLGADDETQVVVLVSKPPAPSVAARVLAEARSSSKPVVVCFLGLAMPAARLGNVRFARSLDEAAGLAVEAADSEPADQPRSKAPPGRPGFVRGLFSGGTLALEALQGLSPFLDPLFSNLSAGNAQPLADLTKSQGHTILDLGEDAFTVGRLHPMIDPDLRVRRFQQEAADPETGLIVVDVVLGEGSHPDPAGALAPAIRAAVLENVAVLALVVGTDEDPQDLNAQIETLADSGAAVVTTIEEAVEHAVLPSRDGGDGVVAGETGSPPLDAFRGPLSAVNLGLEIFYESLLEQGAQVTQVDWRPPAGGDERLLAILDKMKGDA